MNIKRTELIDAYLRNELNSEEIRAFESELAGDPALKEEVGFQQQVVRGLGEFRRAELKSRLTAINIATPWWQAGQILNPGLMKLTGALVTATFIGTGIYYFSNESQNSDLNILPTVYEKDLYQMDEGASGYFEASNAEVPSAIVLNITEGPKEEVEISEVAEANITEASVESAKTSNNLEESVADKDFVPEVALPNPGDGAERVQFKSESAEIPLASHTDIIDTSEKIDIKTTQKSHEGIRYKYYEGKLHLYGNFKDNPYEILEINSTSSKQVYLFHNGLYYKLMTTDKILDLPQITDKLLIQELDIIRNNKVD
ncbi:MAG: hypothetical protein ACFHWX_04800 [Bacteroidota bacterium]